MTITNRRSAGSPASQDARTGPFLDAAERLFMLSPALLCVAGFDGYFKRVNPAFHRTLGYAEADLLSRPFIEFIHPDDRQATLSELRKLSTGSRVVNFENRYRHANGSDRWLLWNTTPVAEEKLLYATAFDITDRKHARESYRTLLQWVPDALIIADHEGKILTINRATETLFGYSTDELVGQSIEVLVPPRFRDEHRGQRSLYAKDPRPRLMGGGLDLSGIRKDGSEFSAEISLGPVESEQGRSVVICAVRDASRRVQTERELKERERRLQALAARLIVAEEGERRRIARGLHDDVGQTLLAAKVMLEDHLADANDPRAQKLQDLLEHAIQTTRTLTFELASTALYEVGLGAALQSVCEHAEEESGIRFRCTVNPKQGPIPEGTKVILYRAGLELVRNVVKHSKARTARVSLSLSGARIRLTVEDDGSGFDASEDLQRPHRMAGFGLFSISQQLDPIGGRLDVASSPGRGTRAIMVVPLDSEGDRA